MRQARGKRWLGWVVPVAALSLAAWACSLNPQPLPPEAPGAGGESASDGGASQDASGGTGLHPDGAAADATPPTPASDSGGARDGDSNADASSDAGAGADASDASDAHPDAALDASDEGG